MTAQTSQKTDNRYLSPEKLEKIRSAVIDLFSSRSFRDVAIRDICKLAGITPNTVYKYFGDKDTLIIKAITPDLDVLCENMKAAQADSASHIENLKVLSEEYFRFYFCNLPLARIVFLYLPSAYFTTHPNYVQQDALEVMSQLIEKGQGEGVFRTDFQATDLVDSLAAIAMRRMFGLLTDENAVLNADEEANRLQRLLLPLLNG